MAIEHSYNITLRAVSEYYH